MTTTNFRSLCALAPEPEPGEVEELCAWLRANSSGAYWPAARAADLLQQLSAAAPPAPEPGDVGELVAELELMANHAATACQFGDAKILSDAATLLQQLPTPTPAVVPVPVTERPWEREGWCDNEGKCWCFFDDFREQGWQYRKPEPGFYDTYMLPHDTISLPPNRGDRRP